MELIPRAVKAKNELSMGMLLPLRTARPRLGVLTHQRSLSGSFAGLANGEEVVLREVKVRRFLAGSFASGFSRQETVLLREVGVRRRMPI